MSSTAAAPAKAPGASGAIVPVLALLAIAASLTQTLLVPLVAQLPRLLHAEASDTAWAVTITLLTGAIANPVIGKLGDMYGKRTMLVLAQAVLAVGSVVIGFADSLPLMLVGRGLQGIAMASIPLAMGIVRDVLPKEKVAGAIGLLSASLGVGGALGLPISALVVQYANWHVLFFASGVLGALGVLLTLTVVPKSDTHDHGRLDIPGVIGLAIGLVLLLLGISKGGEWGWDSTRTLGSFGAAFVVLIGWGILELRVSEPLVDLRTAAKRQVLLTNLASILAGFAMFASSLVPIQLLQLPTATGYGLGQSLVLAGLILAPGGLMMLVGSPIGARITNTRGPKISLLTGFVLIILGYLLGIFLMQNIVEIMLVTMVVTLGIGISYGAMPNLLIAAIPPEQTSAANGLNSLMRSIGTSSSSAVIGAVLAAMTVKFGPADIPSVGGFRTTYIFAAGGALLGLILAAFLRGQRARAVTPVPATAPITGIGIGIEGQALNQHGGPIAVAVLTLINMQGEQIARTVSDPDGYYTLPTEAHGVFTLICSASGHQPEATMVTLGEDIDDGPDFVLTAVNNLAGAVHGPAGPIAGARVILTDTNGTVIASTSTATKGRYELAGISPADYTVTVLAPGHRGHTDTVRIDGARTRYDAELAVTASIHGRLRYQDGHPCQGATVTLLASDGGQLASCITESDGGFLFTDLDLAEYTLTAISYVKATSRITVDTTTRHSIDLSLTDQATLPNA